MEENRRILCAKIDQVQGYILTYLLFVYISFSNKIVNYIT